MPLDPKLWASVPANNPNALSDFFGTHWLWCQDMAQAIYALNQASPRLFPIGSYTGRETLQAVQQQYEAFALALNIAPPGDLSSYDLRDPTDFASWFWNLSQYADTLRKTAGLA